MQKRFLFLTGAILKRKAFVFFGTKAVFLDRTNQIKNFSIN